MPAASDVATVSQIPGIFSMLVETAPGAEFEFKAEHFNLFFDHLPLTPEKIDEVPHLRRQVGLCVLENIRHRFPELRWSLREHQASFEQERTQLVDDASASGDQTIADPMNGLQI